MWRPSWWILPLVSAIVWLAMILAMLLTWIVDGRPTYVSEQDGQTIAYISDVGADKLKPLFIAMSAISVVTFDISFILERWLRHRGKLVRNTSTFQKTLSVLSIIAAIVGAAGIILLSIFDTKRHPRIHNVFLSLFLGGYILSAIFTCWEYQRLGMHFREHSILRASFWVKLAFILLELALAIAFGVLNRKKMWNTAAIVEWVIAFIYTFYVFSFFMDFIPAASPAGRHTGEPQIEEAMSETDDYGRTGSGQYLRGGHGRFYENGVAHGHTNGVTNGYTNGHINGYSNGRTHGYANAHSNKLSRHY